MKNLVFAISMMAGQYAFASKFTSVEELVAKNKISVELNSLGGHSAFCMQAKIQNLSADTQSVWFEAGRRLQAADTLEQDIFLVKEIHMRIPPFGKGVAKLFGFCCQSHDHSPRAGGKFSLGFLAPEKWLKLARLIAANDFDNSAVQHAIWAISNNHATSSVGYGVGNKNKKLVETVATLKNEEMPWYTLEYVITEGQVFSNQPEKITGEIEYSLKNNASITVVIKDWNGTLMKTLIEESPANPGKHTFPIDTDIRKWKDGKYQIYVLADGSNLIAKKSFSLNTGQVRRE